MTPELQKIAVAAARGYLEAPSLEDGRTPVEVEAKLDRDRIELIEKALRPLLTKYLERSISTGDFKRQIDGINKQNRLWGFSGTKGQMFFNLLVNAVDELQSTPELDDQLRLSIKQPANNEGANTILKNFKNYVVRAGQQFIEAGGDPRSKPSPNSIPFFLSYFWQIQEPDMWPVYYKRLVLCK